MPGLTLPLPLQLLLQLQASGSAHPWPEMAGVTWEVAEHVHQRQDCVGHPTLGAVPAPAIARREEQAVGAGRAVRHVQLAAHNLKPDEAAAQMAGRLIHQVLGDAALLPPVGQVALDPGEVV